MVLLVVWVVPVAHHQALRQDQVVLVDEVLPAAMVVPVVMEPQVMMVPQVQAHQLVVLVVLVVQPMRQIPQFPIPRMVQHSLSLSREEQRPL